VDEYQDIDQAQYDLVSAIAGRCGETAMGGCRSWRSATTTKTSTLPGANIEFIRKFQEDYSAQGFISSKTTDPHHIIYASNQLIRHNVDRMKVDHRSHQPRAGGRLPGGRWR